LFWQAYEEIEKRIPSIGKSQLPPIENFLSDSDKDMSE